MPRVYWRHDMNIELADQMIQVGRIVHIPVVDHFVISTEDYYSFDREGKRREKESGRDR